MRSKVPSNSYSDLKSKRSRSKRLKVVAGVVLSLLTLAYIVALFMKVEGAQGILLVIGSGMGFLLGRGSRNTSADD